MLAEGFENCYLLGVGRRKTVTFVSPDREYAAQEDLDLLLLSFSGRRKVRFVSSVN